ncbi:pyridoxal phosphate-dependent decarboxylase family protein [Longirhabdus pacifica]|uniref:pyridoxal phosphate-dependent decarboxylase family protein n=1 Tax=Longirhabdus pacifica TaxID=2305227 RepID=UPI001008B0EA|nr:aspartate aminotransferase family protein [Longirhabdus pacifica]
MSAIIDAVETKIFDAYFPGNNEDSIQLFKEAWLKTQQVMESYLSSQTKPYVGMQPSELNKMLDDIMHMPQHGLDIAEVIEQTGKKVLQHSIGVTHPKCVAHLHTPPLTAAIMAEMFINVMNASMDSWDQSAIATQIEQQMITWLCQQYGLPSDGDGVFTSGGTQSNFMGLLLARDKAIHTLWNWNVKKKGMPPEAQQLKILCSDQAHFTVAQSAALLGLGEQAVVNIRTDAMSRMDEQHLEQTIVALQKEGNKPFVIVATAGTTDFGSIDPLTSISEIAKKYDMWLHVDAAYGGAVAFSPIHTSLLQGIEKADSITIDFHKWFYQSISCGAFIVRDSSSFDFLHRNADYLNDSEDEENGIPNLVGKSIQTTRRFDALKLLMSFQHMGLAQFANMIEHVMALAQQTADYMEHDDAFKLMQRPTLSTVVFRYTADHKESDPYGSEYTERQNQLHQHIRWKLIQDGEAIVAKTKVNGQVCLKFTLLNPRTTLEDITSILEDIKDIAKQSKM